MPGARDSGRNPWSAASQARPTAVDNRGAAVTSHKDRSGLKAQYSDCLPDRHFRASIHTVPTESASQARQRSMIAFRGVRGLKHAFYP